MVAHYMRAHNQWLCMACQGVEEAYLASFRRVSQNFWRDYDRTMRDWCHKSYTKAGRKNSPSSPVRLRRASDTTWRIRQHTWGH